MKDYIHLYTHPATKFYNMDFLTGANDYKIEDLVIICMKELEAISNITIESVDTIYDMDEIDINEHMVNKNYKKKRDDTEIPRFKYMTTDVYAEMRFGIRIKTNLNEKFIIKKILIPDMVDGFYVINNKRSKAIWQLLEASVYTQRGRITLKSRMPIIIYKSKNRPIVDVNGEIYNVRPFSYAMDNLRRKKRGGGAPTSKRNKNKFINPMMLLSAKVGVHKAIKFMGMDKAIKIVETSEPTSETYLYFPLDEVFVKVNKQMFNEIKMVQSVTGMLCNLGNHDYPVEWNKLDEINYWIARVGYVGAPKDKPLKSYFEKGKTAILMVERLYDTLTKLNLRLPDEQKDNIYTILRWMMYEYDNLRQKDNIDINTKRIRKAEYIVKSSLGRKISENINKIIPKLSESRQNSMDTLFEIFNFPSNIIMNGMKNLNDLIKNDDLVNDMNILEDMAYSSKGPESLGENSTKNVMLRMRDIHPSFIGTIDPNCSSNSDVGMSGGSIVPTVTLYDKFFFCKEREPSANMCKILTEIESDAAKNMIDVTPEEEGPSSEVAPTKKNFYEWLKTHDEEVGITMTPIQIVERDIQAIMAEKQSVNSKSKEDK